MSDSAQKVHITLLSVGDEQEVALSVNFDPPMTGEQIKALGYYPASFAMFDKYIMPQLEAAFSDELEQSSEGRTVN